MSLHRHAASLLIALSLPSALLAGSPVDSLDEPHLTKAIDTIEENYLAPSELDATAKKRALLQGLVERLGPGARIMEAGDGPAALEPPPFLAEILDGRFGYIRLCSLDTKCLDQMDAALGRFAENGVPAVILDLRAVPEGGDFEMAAGFAKRFCPNGGILFTIRKPGAKQERIMTSDMAPLFDGILVVLVDADTAGAAEALAASLRANAGAMVVGRSTAGRGAGFADFPLGASHFLRLAVSMVVLPGGGVLFPQGIEPDIEAGMDPAAQARIFELSRSTGVSKFVFDTEEPRLNEAALVGGTNPEIRPEADATGSDDLKDDVLQRAVDLATAILFHRDRR
jgi:hypothetical protein